MLFRLIITRACPVAALYFVKNRKQIKRAIVILMLLYVLMIMIAIGKIVIEEKWIGVICIPLLLFPQYLFYGFAIGSLIRCIWHSWSERVWRRVHCFSLIIIFFGVFTEIFINTKILQIFFKIFK